MLENIVTVSTALNSVESLVTTAINIITGNEVLMTIFCGGLLGIGFRIVKQAKRAAK